MMPKVLFIADKFGYPGGVSFGGTTYFLNILPELARTGVEVTACFLREPHVAAEALARSGITPVFLGARRLDPTVFHRLARVAREHECSVLHASGIKATLMARMAARLHPAKVIVHVHDLLHPGLVLSNLHHLFSRRSDLAIGVSHAVEQTITAGYGVKPDRIRVIYNALELQRFRTMPEDTRTSLRRALGISPDIRVAGMISRMYPVKGHQAMLRMMPNIVAQLPDALLLVIGDGTERSACERIVDKLGLRSNVKFLGQRVDVAQLLSVCDITVMPSESEGLPLSAVESLAMGKPVVAYDVGGMREVIDDNETGVLARFGDTQAFSDAVVALLSDPARLAAFGNRACQSSERFSVEAHVSRLRDCYQELA
jgi:glycosyltransferase involved in cell wall biosynthesis